ncbi:MAG: DUF4982 domain-containing protein [Prevotella sp.]|nr:DUF4982 domain-containing protein [Prevotella sp.]
MKRILTGLSLLMALALPVTGQRESHSLNTGWLFSLGDASSMERDFTHGTEYFTYLAKAGSANHNKGPAWELFNDSAWTAVTLPHDWVVDLPYAAEASHSHGYKQVGWRYPQNSIGWYRRHFTVDKSDDGKRIFVRFDGIFRNSQVFCNGFFLGGEPSGYASQTYDLTDYLNYGGDNVLTVRADASTEEGWYYEGGGIYRDVWLEKAGNVHFIDNGLVIRQTFASDKVVIGGYFPYSDNDDEHIFAYHSVHTLKDATGKVVGSFENDGQITVDHPHLWSSATPYLYTLTSVLTDDAGRVLDKVDTKLGLRQISFDASSGFLINGKREKLRGMNLHLDHAGVGVGVPDELWVYRLRKLREMGVNAIRCSHNPATPAMLDICDSLGFYVIDENRLMGTNDYHLSLLQRMIDRDRNHPSVILWSIGNEEWQMESGERGERIARRMTGFVHSLDASRPVTYGNSGGFGIVKETDVHGYNYIVQNDVENRHRKYPEWVVVGTEETSGSGTRNVYATDAERGWMASVNYIGEERSNGEKNVIERGWKFYRDHDYAAGLFYWTGFDYRGEPNPMKWPSTGSEFGILDYCGFPKDEAYYLKAAWTDAPVLHVFPHWNLKGMEGKPVDVWVYANMDEVELFQDGKSLGRKKMEKDSHLSWPTVYRPGRLLAVGYRNGKKLMTKKVETTGDAQSVKAVTTTIGDLRVIDLTLVDAKGREVPDANNLIHVTVTAGTRAVGDTVAGKPEIIGWGNGDPASKTAERPQATDKQAASFHAFMGKAQVIVRGKGRIDCSLVKTAMK